MITSSAHTDNGMARFHIDTLGQRGIYYHDQPSCERALLEFDRRAARQKDWNAYRAFEPELVMATFHKVFLCDAATVDAGAPGECNTALSLPALNGQPVSEAEAMRRREQLRTSGARMPSYGK